MNEFLHHCFDGSLLIVSSHKVKYVKQWELWRNNSAGIVRKRMEVMLPKCFFIQVQTCHPDVVLTYQDASVRLLGQDNRHCTVLVLSLQSDSRVMSCRGQQPQVSSSEQPMEAELVGTAAHCDTASLSHDREEAKAIRYNCSFIQPFIFWQLYWDIFICECG